MNYHDIVHNDIMNGPGIRVTLFISGCSHHCHNCQNPQTWDYNSGIKFDNDALQEIYNQLDKDYIYGITISGGDPMDPRNVSDVQELIFNIRQRYGNTKSIWVYTGFKLNELINRDNVTIDILLMIDGLVDGEYIEELRSPTLPWVGSSNQTVYQSMLPDTIGTKYGMLSKED